MEPCVRIGLTQLLGLPALDDFFEQAWEREPRFIHGAIHGREEQLLTLDDFELLIASSCNGAASGLSIVEDRVARPVTLRDSDSAPFTAICESYQSGCTLLLSGLQLRWPRIASLCREIENEILSYGIPLAEPVSANAYLTPANAQGFDIHYDNHCALILQLHGTKNWSIFPPLDAVPVARCDRPIRREDIEAPLHVVQLSAGDFLYIPRGFPHCAATADAASLHLTVSVRPVTWSETIKALCDTDPAFRRSVARSGIPSCHANEHLVQELLPRLAAMSAAQFLEHRLAESIEKLVPLPQGGLLATAATTDLNSTLSLNTRLGRTPQVLCSAHEEGGEAVLRFPGASLRLPAQMQTVFQFIAAHTDFTPAMLPGIGPSYDRSRLAQILIKRGLLQIHPIQIQDELQSQIHSESTLCAETQ